MTGDRLGGKKGVRLCIEANSGDDAGFLDPSPHLVFLHLVISLTCTVSVGLVPMSRAPAALFPQRLLLSTHSRRPPLIPWAYRSYSLSDSSGLRKAPCPHGLAQLLYGEKPSGKCLAVSKLRCTIATLCIQEIEEADGTPLVRVFADVAIFLRPLEISRTVELQNVIIRLEVFISVPHVRHDLTVGRLFLILRLRNGELRPGDFSLIRFGQW